MSEPNTEHEETPPDESADSKEESTSRGDPVEALGPLLSVAGRKVWIAVVGIAILIVGAVVWSFCGAIPIQVSGAGVLMPESGVFSIEAQIQGNVDEIYVSRGQVLEKGMAVLKLRDPQEDARYLTAQQQLEALQQDLSVLEAEVDQEAAAEKDAIQREIAATEFRIKSFQDQLPKLQDAVRRRSELYERGLVSIDAVSQAENALVERQVSMEAAEANLSMLRSRLGKAYRHNEITSLERSILSAEHEIEVLDERRKLFVTPSPEEGRLIEVLVETGEIVTVGQAVAWAEATTSSETDRLVFAYVPVDKGKRIEVGNPAFVEVTNVNAQEFGMIKGRVVEVSPYAVSPEGIAKSIHNRSLGQYLMAGLPAVVQVVVAPEKDSSTPSGYAWTSGVGPPFELTTGSICQVKAVVDEITPIHYVFPMWRLKKLMASE